MAPSGRKLRVLHVHSALDPVAGGPVMALVGLARAQAKEELSVSVLATYGADGPANATDLLRGDGVDVKMVGPVRPSVFADSRLKSAIAEAVPAADILHVHALWEPIQHEACRAAMRAGVPYVIRPCGMLDPWSLRQGRLKKRLYMFWRMRKNLDRAAAIHFTTQTECDVVAPLKLAPRTIVEPNGVDLAEFQQLPPKGVFRARHPELGDRPYIVFLGRLYPLKGLELLIPAFAKADLGNAMLVIVGPDGGFLEEARRMARDNGIEQKLVFTGILRGEERIQALSDATLFALPSFHENFGVAVAEGLAAGLPAVVSDHVYIHQEITLARVGGVVRLDIDALAAELRRWMGDHPLRSDAAARARPFVWERYDWRKIAQRWAGHYRKIVSGREA